MPPLFSSGFNKLAQRAGTGIDAPVDEAGHTQLYLSVEEGDAAAVARLLRAGANPRQMDGNGQTPLYAAVAAHDTALVKLLTDKGASFRTEDDGGNTPLLWAIENNADVAFLQELEAQGVDLDFKGESGRGMLHAAAGANNTEVLAWLFDNGTAPDAADRGGMTALHHAVERGAYDAMRLLLDNSADAVLRTTRTRTPLYLAAAKGDETAAAILLDHAEVRRTLNDWRSDPEGYSPLMAAVMSGHVALAERLLDCGAYINDMDKQNRHSLFIAVETGTPGMVAMLIRRGAEAGKAPCLNGGISMMHRIGNVGYKEKLQLLIDAGMDINIPDSSGSTPLQYAVDMNDPAKVSALLELGADPDAANTAGRRPIDRAVEIASYYYNNNSASQIVAALLAGGASPDIAPAQNVIYAPLHVVARSSAGPAPAVVKLLLERGAMVDVPDRTTGATPWLTAAAAGNLGICDLLRQKGADPSAKDKDGCGVLHYAAKSGSVVLLEEGLRNPALKGQLDKPDGYGSTPLLLATKSYRSDGVRVLLAAGADTQIYDTAGQTALHYLARSNNEAMFTLFETALKGKKGAWNVQTRTDKQTPLHIAARSGYVDAINRLLKFDVDLTLQDSLGNTPLMTAIAGEQAAPMLSLINGMKQKNISLDKARDNTGMAAVHLAASGNYSPLVNTAMILDGGADINLPTAAGDTPLHIAVSRGNVDLVKMLAARGADPTLADNAGATPLDIARTLGRQDIVTALQEAVKEWQKKQSMPPPPPSSIRRPRPPAP